MVKTFAAAAALLVAAPVLAQEAPGVGTSPALPDQPGDTATTRFPDTGEVDLDEALRRSDQRQQQQQQAAQPDAAEQPQAAQPQATTGARLGAMDADDLEDRDIYDAQGNELGEIEAVVVDPAHGRIAYAIVELGGFLGVGEREVAVPWQAIKLGPQGDRLVLDVTRERLINAPRIRESEIDRINDPDIASSIHAYFGLEPYWQGQQAVTPRDRQKLGD